MTPRELVRRALGFEFPPRVPRHAWITPWAERHHPREAARLRAEFPNDIVIAPALYPDPPRTTGGPFEKGLFVDEWGCRFENPFDGMLGRVASPLVADWGDLEAFRTPASLASLDVGAIDRFCGGTDRFVLAGTLVRPFERLGFLRTPEQALVDLHERRPPFLDLLDRVARHYQSEVDAWAATRVDAVFLMDDWGTADRLLVDPQVWRALFKPIYRDYCRAAHAAGKFVFMHSDGWILDIVPDLVEIGVDALNSQVGCMGEAALGRYRGQLTFWGEIDRHAVLASGSLDDVRRAARDARENLATPGGGVIAQCEFGPGARPENVLEVFRCWQESEPAA